MKYKVGDKVRIREWEDMKEEFGIDRNGNIVAYEEWHAVDDFGLSYITNRMRRYCGKETKIERIIYYKAGYRLEIDGCVGFWPECALLPTEEPATEVPPKQIAYISGAITGIEDFRKAFEHAKELLAEKGYSAINPANLYTALPESAVYEDYMDICMALVEKADALVLIPGWEKSPGANREMGYAKGLGRKVMTLEEVCKTTNTDGTRS